MLQMKYFYFHGKRSEVEALFGPRVEFIFKSYRNFYTLKNDFSKYIKFTQNRLHVTYMCVNKSLNKTHLKINTCEIFIQI